MQVVAAHRDLRQVQLCALAVDDHRNPCWGHKLQGGLLVVEGLAPVVDLDTCDDSVVSNLGVDGLRDQVLEVRANLALGNLGDIDQINVLRVNILLQKQQAVASESWNGNQIMAASRQKPFAGKKYL